MTTRSQRTAHRSRVVHLAGRSILRPHRHQGRHDASGRALGAERPRETPGCGGRRQLSRTGRGANRPLSASRPRSACPAGDERARPCRSETPGSRRAHWTLQRHRESDRRGEADRRDRLDSGGGKPLARSAVSEWRGPLLRGQSAAAPRVSAARRQEVTLARRRQSCAGRDRGAVRCDAVRRCTGMARRTVQDIVLFLERPQSTRPDRSRGTERCS